MLLLSSNLEACYIVYISLSLVPGPSLTAFFAAVAKSEKSCEGRPGGRGYISLLCATFKSAFSLKTMRVADALSSPAGLLAAQTYSPWSSSCTWTIDSEDCVTVTRLLGWTSCSPGAADSRLRKGQKHVYIKYIRSIELHNHSLVPRPATFSVARRKITGPGI